MTQRRLFYVGMFGLLVLSGIFFAKISLPSASALEITQSNDVKIPTTEFAGVVPHIFFHSLIVYPELAYHANKKKVSLYKNNMITVAQFNTMLQQLYDNHFVLVDSRSLYSFDSQGVVSEKKLQVPVGKKPLIISIDDLNYYRSNKGNGFADKLVVDNGNIAVQVTTSSGKKVITRDGDVVPLIDKFIEQHPDFSFNGAKGIIGVTGYDGILGYRTQQKGASGIKEQKALQPVVDALKKSGWIFASHSFSHEKGYLNGDIPKSRLATDLTLFQKQVIPFIGDTNIFIIPFGKTFADSDPRMKMIRDAGFNVIYGVGLDEYVKYFNNYVVMDRIDIDGYRLVHNKQWLYQKLGITL